MDNNQHTPGPWRVRENPRNDQETCDLSICGDIFVLADLTGPQYSHQLANAHLIAAAPELLEALKDIADPLRSLQRLAEASGGTLDSMAYSIAHDANFLIGIAQRAIAKAKGNSHG